MNYYSEEEKTAAHTRKVVTAVGEITACCMFLIVMMMGVYLTGVASCHGEKAPKKVAKYQDRVLTSNR